MTDVRSGTGLKPVEDEHQLDTILTAVSDLTPDEIMESEAAADLDILSTHTLIDAVEASPDGVFWTKLNTEFEAVATIYVVLNYGSLRESDAMSDSYPAYIHGKFDNGKATIDRITVDTRSFYE